MNELPTPTEDDLAYALEAFPDEALAVSSPAEVRYVVAALIRGEREIYRKALEKLTVQIQALLITAGDDYGQQATLARTVPHALRAFAEKMR